MKLWAWEGQKEVGPILNSIVLSHRMKIQYYKKQERKYKVVWKENQYCCALNSPEQVFDEMDLSIREEKIRHDKLIFIDMWGIGNCILWK